jgi:CheY-like chemotaxis protein
MREGAMAGQKIFVSNHDETYIEMIRDILADAGYSDVMWHVGKGVYHRIRDEQPDLVLLDINMADPARGWMYLDMLKLGPRTRHIPIILCSTDPHLPEQKAEMLANLHVDFLEKPFDLEILLEKVAAVVGSPQTS